MAVRGDVQLNNRILTLLKEVGLLVGLSGGGGGWFWGESGVGTWTGLEVGVGLNSKGEELWLTDSILLIRGMHGVTCILISMTL